MNAFIRILHEEVSTLFPDMETWVRIVVRLLIAAILGGMLGYERERLEKAAGLRTHMLVAVGTTLFVFLPMQADFRSADLSRVIQGVASGIGFLGAGTILKLSEEREIKGLTTAANIWLTAAVGVAVGLGQAGAAIASTLLSLLVLSAFRRVERKMHRNANGEKGQEP